MITTPPKRRSQGSAGSPYSVSSGRRRTRGGRLSTPGTHNSRVGICKYTTTEGIQNLLGEFPSDVLVTIVSFRNDLQTTLPPVVTLAQIYSVIQARTIVDREIGKLCQNGSIIKLRLGQTLSQGTGIIFVSDYKHLAHVAERNAESGNGGLTASSSSNTASSSNVDISPRRKTTPDLLLKFTSHIIAHHSESMTIPKTTLVDTLSLTEDDITHLTFLGFLTLDPNSPSLYILSVPRIGSYVLSLSSAVKDVTNSLKRKKFGEMLENQLSHREGDYKVPVKTVVAELLGRGLVKRIDGADGSVLKLVGDIGNQSSVSKNIQWST